MKKNVSIFIVFLFLIFAFSLKIYIERGNGMFAKNLREKIYLTPGTKIVISDQMFKPRNIYFPLQKYHFFLRDSVYSIEKVIHKDMNIKLILKSNFENEKRQIDLRSIRYPEKIFFSGHYCTVDINTIKDNNVFVYFKENKLYPYIKKEKGDEIVVLDDRRNQVSLQLKNIIIKEP